MAFEKLDATQVCTWAPPLPQRAFPVQQAGVTSEGASLGGTAVNGQRYGYFLLDTSLWTVQPGLNLSPLSVGERFQLCTSAGNGVFIAPPDFASGEGVPQAGLVTASSVVMAVPDGNGNWIAVIFPSIAAFEEFFTLLGATNGYYPGNLTPAQVDAAIGDVGGTIGSSVVIIAVPDGTGGWQAVSWPSVADFSSFFTQIGGSGGFYPNGLDPVQIDTAIAQNGGTIVPPGSFSGEVVNSAPDLFNVSGMFPELYTVKDPTLCTVVSTRQSAANSWYVYYSPYNPSVTAIPGRDGIVTVPELSHPKWLGEIGHVSQLDYTYSIPGGPDQFICSLWSSRTTAPKRSTPAGSSPATEGRRASGKGSSSNRSRAPPAGSSRPTAVGNYGTNFGAWWQNNAATPRPPTAGPLDGPIDFAIARGLRWANYGLAARQASTSAPCRTPAR